jgi:hypothetical protein
MRNFLFWLASEAPSDVVIDDTWYSPGVVGFLATFGVAGAAILIIFDMTRRVRRVRYRAEIVQKLDLEQQLGESARSGDSKP